jgi:hypothetical protein
MAKSDTPKSNKKSGILFLAVAAIGGAAIAWDQGLLGSNGEGVSFGDSKPKFTVPRNLPENAEFVRSEDPNEPSKIITDSPPPQRVQTAKDLSVIVGDYINASPDKEAARGSLKFTMALPSITKEYKVQQQQTEIARMKFEEKEWELKLLKLDAQGLDGFESEEINKVQTDNFAQGTFYNNAPVGSNAKEKDSEIGTKLSASDFTLLSVTETATGELVALLNANGKEYEVLDKANINGQFDITIESLTQVLICDADDCMPIY